MPRRDRVFAALMMLVLVGPLAAGAVPEPDVGALPAEPAMPAEDPRIAAAAEALLTLATGPDTDGTPFLPIDWPFFVDEDGDSMTGDLAFGTGLGVQLGGTRLTANPSLTFGSVPVCLAGSSTPGCTGGDITGVTAGSGLTGGGLGGDVTLAVNPVLVQNRVSGVCAAGFSIRVINQDGTVTCEQDDDTTYSAGTGLNLVGTTFSVNTGAIQNRVVGTCSAGSSIRVVAQDGTTTCEADDDTTYMAGNGLALTGTTFRLLDCNTSQIPKAGSGGAWACGADSDTTYTAGSGLTLTGTQFSVNTGTIQSRVTGTCAVGSYVRAVAQDGTVTCSTDANSGGTVTSIAGGSGLTGGTITGSGTLAVDTATIQNRVMGSCAAGSSIRVIVQDGTVTCQADADTNSGGTVTSVGSGSGLTGGPVTGSGTLSIATGGVTSTMIADGTIVAADADTTSLQRRVAATCSVGSSIRAIAQDGTVTCETDDDTNSGGDITAVSAGTGLTGGATTGDATLSVDTAAIQNRVTGTCAAGNSIRVIAQDGTVTCETDDSQAYTGATPIGVVGTQIELESGPCADDGVWQWNAVNSLWDCNVIATGWQLSGNAGTTPGTDFLGTTDNRALEVKVNGTRVVRYQPDVTSPNILGGHSNNSILAGVFGATIAGGGDLGGSINLGGGNLVTDEYGVVGGGAGNQAGDNAGSTGDKRYAAVAGGQNNKATGNRAFVGGGNDNTASNLRAAVLAGGDNVASGTESVVGGGASNTASGGNSVVGGGDFNRAEASWATVAGGDSNLANNSWATVAGGQFNEATARGSFIGAGRSNDATGENAGVAAGQLNAATADWSFVGGGHENSASGLSAVVAGGYLNNATSQNTTIAGGYWNNATAAGATVGGGVQNTASGIRSMVPGGFGNTAAGTGSFAAGQRAKANHDGSFVWSDNQGADFASTAQNQFLIRAAGGVGVGETAPTESVHTSGDIRLGRDAWTTSANDRIISFGDEDCGGPCVYIGEKGAEDRMEIKANFVLFPVGTSVGIGGLPQANLDVEGGTFEFDISTAGDTVIGLCKNVADGDGTDLRMVECNGTPGDVAEWYDVDGARAGDIVVATEAVTTYRGDLMDPWTGLPLGAEEEHRLTVLAPSAQPYAARILGVISTNPAVSYGKGMRDAADDAQPLAIAGRVPVRVTAADGAIHPGDPITSSMLAGVGMLAREPGPIVGYALDHFEGAGVGSILVYVAPGWHGGAAAAELAGENAALQHKVDDLEARLQRLEALAGAGGSAPAPALAHVPADAPAPAQQGGILGGLAGFVDAVLGLFG